MSASSLGLYPPSRPSSAPAHRPGSASAFSTNASASASTSSRGGPGSGLGLHARTNAGPGGTPSGSGYGTPNGYGANGGVGAGYAESPYGGYGGAAHQLEGQNDERLEGLMGKVRMLKDITVGIGDEVRASNAELGRMNDAFASTSTLLSGTFGRMKSMARRQGGRWCWFMMFLVLVAWIFVGVWAARKVGF